MPQQVGDVYRIRAYCYNDDTQQVGINNVYNLVTAITGVGATDQEICNRFNTLLAPFYKGVQSINTRYYGISAQRIAPLPVLIPAVTNVSAGIGTLGGGVMPNQVSALIRLTTNIASRHGRGRIYPPFPPASATDVSGKMTAAFEILLQQLAAAWLGPFVVTGAGGNSTLQPVIQSVVRNPGPPPTRIVSYLNVIATQGIQRFATQRRRGQYGRTNPLPF